MIIYNSRLFIEMFRTKYAKSESEMYSTAIFQMIISTWISTTHNAMFHEFLECPPQKSTYIKENLF